MKKGKLKKLKNTVRKAAREGIELRLINELKEIVSSLGEGSQKIEKEIKKGAQKLAKKITGSLKIDNKKVLSSSKTATAAAPKPAPKNTVKKTPAATTS